jgi:hypothetical protein
MVVDGSKTVTQMLLSLEKAKEPFVRGKQLYKVQTHPVVRLVVVVVLEDLGQQVGAINTDSHQRENFDKADLYEYALQLVQH